MPVPPLQHLHAAARASTQPPQLQPPSSTPTTQSNAQPSPPPLLLPPISTSADHILAGLQDCQPQTRLALPSAPAVGDGARAARQSLNAVAADPICIAINSRALICATVFLSIVAACFLLPAPPTVRRIASLWLFNMAPDRNTDKKRRKSAKEPELIALPGPVGPDGQLTERIVDLSALVNKEKKELLAQYGEHITGNADVLNERLRAFSANRARWNIILPSYKGNLKNRPSAPRKKKTRVRLSDHRKGLMLGIDGETGSTADELIAPSVPAVRGPGHGADLLAWSERSCQRHPYRPPPDMYDDDTSAGPAPMHTLAPVVCTTGTSPAQASPTVDHTTQILEALTALRRDLVARPLSPVGPLDVGGKSIMSDTPTSSPRLNHQIDSSSPQNLPPLPAPEAMGCPCPAAIPGPTQGLPIRTLVLPPEPTFGITQRIIEFTDDQILNIPIGGIGTDIARIARMWDFSEAWWRRESPLTVLGHPIPLVYWRELLADRVPRVWSRYKSVYIKWRDAAMEYRKYASDDLFWEEWSCEDGRGGRKRMTFTQITGGVRALRMQAADALAGMARAAYGDGREFTDKFSYKKGGRIYVYQKAAHIAQRYIQLQDLEGAPVAPELRELVAGDVEDL